MNRIVFLGTGGARVLVFKQILASGGLWIEMAGTRIHLDPGPGALVQAIKRKLDPTKLDAVVLSHRHLDHAADVNVMIEAMTTGGFNRRGLIFAPSDAYEGDPVVLRYVRDYVRERHVIEEGGKYDVGDLRFSVPVRHDHPGEVYGLVFESPGCRWSYVADTRYFPELVEHYRAEVMVLNTVLLEESEIYHPRCEASDRGGAAADRDHHPLRHDRVAREAVGGGREAEPGDRSRGDCGEGRDGVRTPRRRGSGVLESDA